MNYTNNKRILTHSALVLAMLGSLAGCGSDNDDTSAPSTNKPPQLSPAVGVKMTGSCSNLLGFQYNNTVISSA
ncbi:tannase/feruloyl esterase family alpha/beta hydrolase, partial [Acinetobacter baumannii]